MTYSITSEHLIPARVTPPATTIYREMEAHTWSITDLALYSQLSEEVVQQLLDAEIMIDAEIAHKLMLAFDIPARFWIQREARYQEFIAHKLLAAQSQTFKSTQTTV